MLRVILGVWILAFAAVAEQTVEGHVVNSATGAGVPGVAVNLVQAGLLAYSATTDSQGRFRIEAVKDGTYSANYSAGGFWPVPNLLIDEDLERQCGGCFLSRHGPEFRVASGGEPMRLTVKLSPIGKISGRVLDGSGKPVPNATVEFYWGENWLCKVPSCTGISRGATTDEKGAYSISDLDVPGRWLLSAVAPSSWAPPESAGQRLGWARTFYPGFTDSQLAAPVMVRPGVVLDLDIRLRQVPVHRVSGVVFDLSGNPAPKAAVMLFGKGTSLPAQLQSTRADGTFAFGAVGEGDWRIVTKVDPDGAKLWAAQSIQVKSEDLANLKLRLVGPFSIQGKILMDGPEGLPTPKPPSVTVGFNVGSAVRADTPGGGFRTGDPDAAGGFTIPNLYPGPYEVLPGPAPPGYYLDSIRLGDRDALASDVPILPWAPPLVVTYKSAGGSVRGTVEKCASGAVWLIPEDKTLRRSGFLWFVPCDSFDRYAVTAVRPGDYYVLAIAGDSPTPWYEAIGDDGLLTEADKVTVRAGEASLVDLRAIAIN